MSNLKTKAMRVINVVKIKNGVVDDIESFGVVDEGAGFAAAAAFSAAVIF